MNKEEASVQIPMWKWIGAIGLIALLLASAGYGYYRYQANSIREVAYNELKAIADLKSNDLSVWRSDRLHDASMNSTGRIRTDGLKWLADTSNTAYRDATLEDLRFFRDQEGYANMLIAGVDGGVLLSLDPGFTELEPEAKSLVAQAVSTQGSVVGDFFLCSACNTIHLDTAAPIMGADGRPAAILILRSDPERYLYPLIESWPTQSRSAETVLVRREGDQVLFLNKMRFQPDSALTMQIPLSENEVPAVRAALGGTGMFEGIDYRGVEVLADIRSVPDTPWFLVAKVDADEILAEARYRGLATLFIVGLFIVITGLMAAFMASSRRKNLYMTLFTAEREHRQMLEEFRATLRGIGDGVIATDAEGRVRHMNPIAEELTGWSEAEAAGHQLKEVFHILNEETRADVENPVDRVLRESRVVGLANHTILIARDGTEKPIADSGAPIHDEDGSLVGVALVFRDRSEERAAERVLQESEAMLKQSQRVAGVGHYNLDVATGLWTCSEMLDEIFGIDEGFTKNVEGWVDLVHPDQRSEMREYLSVHVLKHGKPFNKEYRIIRMNDHAERWLHGLGELDFDSEGKPKMMFGTIQDITEGKQAEAFLNEALVRTEDEKEKNRAIIEGIGDGVSIQDTDFKVLFQNQVHKDFIGDHIGEYCFQGYEKRDEICDGCPVALTYADGKVHLSERTVEFPEGIRYFEITASPLRNAEGQIIGGIEAVREVTDRKRADEEKESLRAQLLQAQKMEAVGRLAGGVAHDFNNMLGVILGYAQLAITETPSGEKLHSDLQEIINAARRSTDLTRQLLAFARRQSIDPRVMNLNEITVNLLNMVQRLIGEDIKLVWKPGHDLSLVKVDPAQIDQLLVNLAVNSRDAIETVGVMTVETANVSFDAAYCKDHVGFVPGDYVMLAISDDGRGIPQDVIDHIFEPFFTTKDTSKGTGLGLSMVYGIVKQNNGFINVYSEPGQGTTIRIYLPIVQGEATAVTAADEKIATGGSETVLIVEDEEEILNIGKTVLRRAGYTVLDTTSPDTALRLAKEYEGAIDLLITDVIMPEMNGKDLRDRLVELRPGIKVLFMSGYTADVIAERGVLEAGVMFLQKPFSVNALAVKVREVLDS
jgi:PAS domain S-box-containing protein